METDKSKNLYKPIIDFLRAFAVLAVLINHLNKDYLPSGFLGVDIFFVISGYVITQSLYTRYSQSPKTLIREFYKRRIKRIIPGLLIFIIFTSIFTYLFLKSTGEISFSGIFSSLGLSNLYFLKISDSGYFGSQLEFNPFTNTWSLAVEEQFYLIYPIIFLFIRHKNLKKIFFFLIGFYTISIFLFLTSQPNSSYFLPTHRAWEFFSGCIVFFLAMKCTNYYSKDPQKNSWQINFVSFTCILLIGLSLIKFSEFNYLSNLIIVFLTTLIIFNYHNFSPPVLLSNKFFIYIGKRSYSIYLWHWPIIVLIKSTIGLTNKTTLITLILTFLVSELSYTFVEKPFLENKSFYVSINFKILSILPLITGALIAFYQTFLPNSLFIGSSVRANNFINNDRVRKKGSKILFVGNSHALHLIGLAEELKYKHNFNPLIYSYSSKVFPLKDFEPRKFIDYFNVEKISSISQNNNYYKLINKMGGGDFLVISERNSLNLKSPFLEKELKQVLSKGIKIIVFLPTVEFEKFYKGEDLLNPELCTKDWFRKKIDKKRCDGEYSDLIKRKDSINFTKMNDVKTYINKFVEEGFKIKTLNPNDILCSKELIYCSTRDVNNAQIFRDDDHLTIYGSKKLTNLLLNMVMDNSW